MRYKACIFDLDGTLCNTLFSIADYANDALQALGYPGLPADDYRKLVGNGANRLMERMLDAACPGGHTPEDTTRLREVYDKLYESDPLRGVTDYPGMPETVAALRKNGFPAAVFSNKPHNCTEAIVNGRFPAGSFACCYGQREGVPRKPSPEGALLIAGELGFDPKDLLYIGDTNTDMQTGAAAGMDTAGVLWGFRDRQELMDNHAKYLVERPGELLSILFGES